MSLAERWPLDRGVVFLNHGSFGACPTEVLRHRAALRAEMQAEPVRLFSRELDERLDAARRALAGFVGADRDDLAFVANATSGVNAVLRSLVFGHGDELLTTDHAYNACRNTLGDLRNHDADAHNRRGRCARLAEALGQELGAERGRR